LKSAIAVLKFGGIDPLITSLASLDQKKQHFVFGALHAT